MENKTELKDNEIMVSILRDKAIAGISGLIKCINNNIFITRGIISIIYRIEDDKCKFELGIQSDIIVERSDKVVNEIEEIISSFGKALKSFLDEDEVFNQLCSLKEDVDMELFAYRIFKDEYEFDYKPKIEAMMQKYVNDKYK